jgi:hypothetical protein
MALTMHELTPPDPPTFRSRSMGLQTMSEPPLDRVINGSERLLAAKQLFDTAIR